MKGKNIARIIIFTLIILYSTLYITQALGYYEYTNRKTNTLTENAVKEFEKDIASGKKVVASNYVKSDSDYSNKLSKMGISISNIIGNIFDGIMDFIFKEINQAVND